MSQQNIPHLLKLQEVTQITRLSKATIYREIKKGDFPNSIKVSGRRVAWRAEDLKSWFDRKAA